MRLITENGQRLPRQSITELDMAIFRCSQLSYTKISSRQKARLKYLRDKDHETKERIRFGIEGFVEGKHNKLLAVDDVKLQGGYKI